MLCQDCGQRPASVQLSQTAKGKKEQLYLCDLCAQQFQGQVANSFWDSFPGSLLPGPSMFGYPATTSPSRPQKTGLICPSCGETEEELRKTGLLGCQTCYETFAVFLDPVFRRVQGHTRHLSASEEEGPAKEADVLREKLELAVQSEDYEEAARLRDQIRQLEEDA